MNNQREAELNQREAKLREVMRANAPGLVMLRADKPLPAGSDRFQLSLMARNWQLAFRELRKLERMRCQ